MRRKLEDLCVMTADWESEVAEALADVWAELDDEARAWVEGVPVLAKRGDGSSWGTYFVDPKSRWIEVYESTFDLMPDPENRQRQVRDVIRHELAHAQGERHPTGPVAKLNDATWRYYTGGEVTIEVGDLVVCIPEVLP